MNKEELAGDPGFWDDPSKAEEVLKEIKSDRNWLNRYDELKTQIEDVEVFNVVTPNGDGAHDYLMITGLEPRPINDIRIFNRWGILIYTTESYNTIGNTFDGTSQGRSTVQKGEKLPAGTYFYILSYEDVDGSKKVLSGHLYLN